MEHALSIAPRLHGPLGEIARHPVVAVFKGARGASSLWQSTADIALLRSNLGVATYMLALSIASSHRSPPGELAASLVALDISGDTAALRSQ